MQMFSFVSFVSYGEVHVTLPECHNAYFSTADHPEFEIALLCNWKLAPLYVLFTCQLFVADSNYFQVTS